MKGTELQYRHELKYLISDSQKVLLKSRIDSMMSLDPHVGDSGSYLIRSLYFDDYQNRCYYENENGTDPREKFRIRIYNRSTDRIMLECKRKERGKTLKTACPLTLQETQELMSGNSPGTALTPLRRKLDLEMKMRLLRPVVIVEYERIPYIYRDGNVRVTFDMNISASADVKSFLSGTVGMRPILPPGMHLLEVKFDEFLPDFIYRSLNLGELQLTAFSKYYLCRKYTH